MSRSDIPEVMREALAAYESGFAVIIESTDGVVLHGRETLDERDALAEPSLPLQRIGEVDRIAFEASNCREVLEQARQDFLKRRKK